MSNAIRGSSTIGSLQQNEQKLLTSGAGNYTLTILGETSGVIASTASPGNLQTILEAMAVFAVGDVVVTGVTADFNIAFAGNYLGQNIGVLVPGGFTGSVIAEVGLKSSLLSALSITAAAAGNSSNSRDNVHIASDGATLIRSVNATDGSVTGTYTAVAGVPGVLMFVNDQYAISTVGVSDLEIWDYTQVTPATHGSVNLGTGIKSLVVGPSKSYAYCVDDTATKLFVVDITDLTNPNSVGSVVNAGLTPIRGLAVNKDETLLYARDSSTGTIEIFDISTKATPVFLATFSDALLTGGGNLISSVDNLYLYTNSKTNQTLETWQISGQTLVKVSSFLI